MKTSESLNHSNYISVCISVGGLYFFSLFPVFCNVFIFFLECFNCICFDLVLGIHPRATTKNVCKKALRSGSSLGVYNVKQWKQHNCLTIRGRLSTSGYIHVRAHLEPIKNDVVGD